MAGLYVLGPSVLFTNLPHFLSGGDGFIPVDFISRRYVSSLFSISMAFLTILSSGVLPAEIPHSISLSLIC
jgi:hypothetical protein